MKKRRILLLSVSSVGVIAGISCFFFFNSSVSVAAKKGIFSSAAENINVKQTSPKKNLIFSANLSQENSSSKPPENSLEPIAQKLHVYVDEKNNVYWPMDLPFWIRLATTPEDGGESYLMQKLELNQVDDESQEVKEGIKLEIPGKQFIRWVNYVSKEETKYRFFGDGAAPNISVELSKAPTHSTPERVYYGINLVADVIANDDLSGVLRSYLAINSSPFQVYEKQIAIPEENLYTLKYYSVDKVGYVSKVLSSTFQVDLTPPSRPAKLKKILRGGLSPLRPN